MLMNCQLQQQVNCTSVVSPADAGRGVFDGLSDSSAVAAVIGAGAVIASLLFAVFAVRAVAMFFRACRDRRAHPSARPAASLQRASSNDLDGRKDVELDLEDDAEASDEDDHDEDSPAAQEKHQ